MSTEHDLSPAPDPETTNPDQPEHPRRVPPALNRLIAAVLAVVLLAAAVVAGFLVYNRGQVEAELEERADAARAAEEFVVRFNTYDAGTVEGYIDALSPMLTTSARAEFEKAIQDTTTLIRETELRSEGELLASGVASVDQDDATVLVAVDADADSIAGPIQRHFRWEIDLARVDGDWLVDDFDPVAGQASP